VRRRLLLLGLLALCACAARAPAELTAKLSLGLGKPQYVSGCWNRAVLEVSNPGPPLTGEWQVAMRETGAGESDPPSSTYSIPDDIPTGTSRAEFALIFPGFGADARLRFVSAGRVLFDTTRRLNRAEYRSRPLILTDRPAGFGEPGDEGFTAIDVRDAPSDARAYDAVSVIVLDRPGVRALPAQSLRTIDEWVLTGGTLVLTAPCLTESAGGQGLAPFALVASEGFRPVPDPRYIARFLDLKPAEAPLAGRMLALRVPRTEVLAETGGLPLAFEHLVGAGKVRGVAIDPAWLRFGGVRDEYGFARQFCRWLAQQPSREPFFPNGIPWSLVPNEGRADMMGVALLPIAILFVLVVGPANWALLTWRKRKEWLVFTTPIAALAFLALTALVCAMLHSRQATLVYESVGVTAAGAPGAGIFRMEGVYLPSEGSCQLAFPRHDAVVRECLEQGFLARMNPVANGTWLRLGDRVALPALASGRWSMRAFTDTDIAPEASVDGELTVRGDRLAGYVVNHLRVAMRDCYVVHKWSHALVGDLQPGERKAISLPLGPPGVPKYQLTELGYLIGPEAWFNPTLWTGSWSGSWWVLAQGGLGSKGAARPGAPFVIGTVKALSPPPTLTGVQYHSKEEHLLVAQLPLSVRGPGELSAPIGAALESTTWAWSSWLPATTSHEQEREEYGTYDRLFEFRLPLDARRVRHGSLTIEGQLFPSTGNGAPATATVLAYDWAKRDWVSVRPDVKDRYSVPVPDLARFILMPAGLVRVWLKSPAERTTVYPIWTDIAYRGEVVAG
jgi:hypothetical protein